MKRIILMLALVIAQVSFAQVKGKEVKGKEAVKEIAKKVDAHDAAKGLEKKLAADPKLKIENTSEYRSLKGQEIADTAVRLNLKNVSADKVAKLAAINPEVIQVLEKWSADAQKGSENAKVAIEILANATAEGSKEALQTLFTQAPKVASSIKGQAQFTEILVSRLKIGSNLEAAVRESFELMKKKGSLKELLECV